MREFRASLIPANATRKPNPPAEAIWLQGTVP
jgi:hypothetical protein